MLNFSDALEIVKAGGKVSRAGWNGKGMWLTLCVDWSGYFSGPAPRDYEGFLPFIAMYTVDKKFVPWLASQTDILAVDWDRVWTSKEIK